MNLRIATFQTIYFFIFLLIYTLIYQIPNARNIKLKDNLPKLSHKAPPSSTLDQRPNVCSEWSSVHATLRSIAIPTESVRIGIPHVT